MTTVIHKTTLEIRYGVNEAAYDSTVWFINPDLSGVNGIPQPYWKVENDAIVEMTQAEKDAVDASELAPAKIEKIQVLDLAVRNYVYSHYEPHRQTTFSILMADAIKNNYLNRYAYIASAFAWAQNGPLGYYYVKAYEINVQTTIAGVEAVTWDLPALFDASDPVVTIYNSVTMIELPIITSALTANGTQGTAFSYTITGEGSVRTPASYDATNLPSGLSVNTTTGVISGTPDVTAIGTHNVTITATNSAGTDTKTLVLTIAAA